MKKKKKKLSKRQINSNHIITKEQQSCSRSQKREVHFTQNKHSSMWDEENSRMITPKTVNTLQGAVNASE